MKLVDWLLALPLTVVLLVFALSNRVAIEVNLWPLPFTVPAWLSVVILAALGAGFVLGLFVATLGGRRWRRKARQVERRLKLVEQELAATQAQYTSLQATGGQATGSGSRALAAASHH